MQDVARQIRVSAPNRAPFRSGFGLAAVAVLTLALGACSTLSSKEKAKDVPGAKKPFPNLASVPDKKPDVATERQRMKIQEGLFADRRNARYLEGGPRAGYGRAPDKVSSDAVRAEIINPGRARAASGGAARRVRTVDGVRIVRAGFIARVNFAKNDTSLPSGSGRTIVRIAQLQRVLQSTITVIGRAAPGESRGAGLTRARAVANGLVTLGVPGNKIRVRSGGTSAARVDVYQSGGRVPKR